MQNSIDKDISHFLNLIKELEKYMTVYFDKPSSFLKLEMQFCIHEKTVTLIFLEQNYIDNEYILKVNNREFIMPKDYVCFIEMLNKSFCSDAINIPKRPESIIGRHLW